MNKVSIFINNEPAGYISFNDARKITALKFSHIAKFILDDNEVVLYATSQDDAIMKTRKYLLEYDCYEY
tara:strand:+ start:510 stop:716 length:207 start_codon:yes stop_codon:yes gene_type:complete